MSLQTKNSLVNIKPMALPVLAENIPEKLRAIPRWVLWKYYQATPNSNWTKVPKTIKGHPARTNDSSTWATFEQAFSAYKSGAFDGVGFVLGQGIDGVDVDDSYDSESGKLSELAQLALRTVDGYAEISPSDTGIKIFAMTNLERSHRSKQLELYDGDVAGRYFCVTGHVIPSHQDLSEDIQDVSELVKFFDVSNTDSQYSRDGFSDLGNSYERWSLDRIQREILPHFYGNEYSEWLQMGMMLHNESDASAEGLEVWDEWSAKYSGYEPDACKKKWSTFGSNGSPKITLGTYIAKLKSGGLTLPSPTKGPLHVYSIPELMSQPSQSWLIKGVIPRTGTGVIYGDSGAGKTFITLDMALAVARKIPWQGKRVKEPVGVLYVSAEGGSAMKARIKAYTQYHDLSNNDLPFGIVPASVNLRSDDATRVIDACRGMAEREHQVGLIIFDTLNRTMGGGDENSSKDMGEYLDAVGRIADQTRAFCLVVHHSGKNKQMGARGHSSLRAAVDVEFEVKADGDQQVLTVTKSRDGETGAEFVYQRKVVTLGIDEDFDVIDSCVAIPGDPGSLKSQKPKAQGKWQDLAYQALSILGEGVSTEAVVEKIGVECDHISRWRDNAKRGVHGCLEAGVFISRGGLLYFT